VCVGGVLIYMHVAYSNGIDPLKDGGQIVVALLSYAGIGYVKNVVTKPGDTGGDA